MFPIYLLVKEKDVEKNNVTERQRERESSNQDTIIIRSLSDTYPILTIRNYPNNLGR